MEIQNNTATSKKTISLCELQKWMRWVIVDPRGVEEALKNPHPLNSKYPKRYVAPQISAYDFFDNTNVNVQERLSVYAEGYFLRIVEVIEADFPLTHKILGHEKFLELICDYLKVYPSSTPNISEVSSKLSLFVKTHHFQKNKPYLSDAVSLEWNLIESFYANSMPDFNLLTLSGISEEQWENAKIVCDPSLRILSYDWPIDILWHNHTKDNFNLFEQKLKRKNIYLSVFRSVTVSVEEITRTEYKCLKLMKDGYALGTITDRLNVEPEHLTKWFSKWVHSGLIKRIDF